MDFATHDSALTIALRIFAAAAAGAILGINRDLNEKPIGLRTLSLVSIGSAGAVLLCINFSGGSISIDIAAMSRVLQGLMTGIGFLGAGVILHAKDGRHIYGLTTAATIWVAAVLGVACGLGAWIPMLLVGITVLIVLVFGGPLEQAIHRWFERRWSRQKTE